MKKIIKICLLLFILCNLTTVYASNVIDFDKKGSISLSLIESNTREKISGANIKIIKIADARVDSNGNLAYQFVSELSTCNVSLTNLEDTNIKQNIEACITSDISLVEFNNITDSDGKVYFDDLDLGLYLLSQEGQVEGFSNIDSFLITVPTIIENDWVYDLECEPKTEIIKVIDLTITKVWKNNNKKISKNVTINLLRDGNVIDTVILDKNNNWTYTFKRIPASDGYSVEEVNIPNGYKVVYKNDGYNFTVINANKLPQTGELGYLVPIFAFIGMTFIVLGFIVEKKSVND